MGNCLLAALPASDLDLLGPELETIALEQDAVLSRPGDDIEYVIFPHKGAITLMIDMANGETVATAAIGREGAVGFFRCSGRHLRPLPPSYVRRARPPGSLHRDFTPLSAGVPRSGTRSKNTPSDADTVPARLGLQCAAPGRGPHGALAAPASRPHRPRRASAHPACAGANTWCATNDGNAPDAQSPRARSDQVRSTRPIEIDRARLAAAACECHGFMRSEVEEIFSSSAARSRAAILAEDWRIPRPEPGDTT